MERLSTAVPLKDLPALHGAGVTRNEHLQRGVTGQEHQLQGKVSGMSCPSLPVFPRAASYPPEGLLSPMPLPSAPHRIDEHAGSGILPSSSTAQLQAESVGDALLQTDGLGQHHVPA